MITVIVPVRNAEKSLPKCLYSIKNQTYHNLQIILINNGSIDKSGDICEKFVKNDSRFQVTHIESSNLSVARNIGLSLAQGEYICFINDVDWIDVEMLEKLMDTNRLFNGDMVTCRYYEDSISELFLPPGPDEIKFMTTDEAIQLCLSQPKANGFLCNKLYKTKLFNSIPTIRFDEEIVYYEDLLVAMQLFLKSQTIVYSPPPHYHYYLSRHVPVSVLQNKGKLTGLKAIEKAIDLLSQDSTINTLLFKEQYIRLTLSSLFALITSENVHSPYINELREHIHHYSVSGFEDKDLKKCCRITRRNIGLGKIYWDMFYKKKLRA